MIKTLIGYAVVATALLLWCFYAYRNSRTENRRLAENQQALSLETEHYRTRLGEEAASVQALRLRCAEFETLRAAADVVDAGADIGVITYEVFRKQSKARAKLYAEVISRLRYDLDDRLVTALVTQEQLAKYGLKQDATEGIVDFGLTVSPVEVSVCMMEVRRGQYKASLRSKGTVNVNEVAGVFCGGGHVLASGCMFFGDYEEAYDKLRYAVAQRLPQ